MVPLAVTGTLQDGFSMRRNLDYTDSATGAVTEAVFAGWGLCRGLEAYLDVKEPGCREHANPPLAVAADGVTAAPYISPACIATGDRRHANLYAVFLVHRLAVLHALCNLPRYLAIASDLVQVDLTAEATSPELRTLLRAHAAKESASSLSSSVGEVQSVGVLAVVATFLAPSFIKAPIVSEHEDGTQVTRCASNLH